MVAKLQLFITENNKVIETVIKETSAQPACMIKSLEEFQMLVNAALTRVVENTGGSDGTLEAEIDEASDEDETDGIVYSPKKKRPRRRQRQKRKEIAC